MTVEEYHFRHEGPGVDKAGKEAKLAGAKQLQIEPLLDRRPAQLSGGQRQRGAMGRVLFATQNCFSLTSRCRS